MATLCMSGAVLLKAGENASSDFYGNEAAEAKMNSIIEEGEALLNIVSRYDWVTNYAGLNAIAKKILEDACSDYAAMKIINYGMANYSSTEETATMLNVLHDNLERIIKIISDDDNKTFIQS